MIDELDFPHAEELRKSYDAVGNEVAMDVDLSEENLLSSRQLFVPDSLSRKKPIPKHLDVYALISGVSFSENFQLSLTNIQAEIVDILDGKLAYFVQGSNLGVEYCVFKWPDDTWHSDKTQTVHDILRNLTSSAFNLSISGIQLHRDGCIIARGYDQNKSVYKIRKHIQSKVEFLPIKQSSWCHVPLGRILEPIGAHKMEELKRYINTLNDKMLLTERINQMQFVHEKQWYMEKSTILRTIRFA